MGKEPTRIYEQSGVIPFLADDDGIRVMLITSMHSKKWIVPKGIIETPLTAAESAAEEALEEAGVKGRVHPDPVGEYEYEKWGGTCTVEVFLLEVEEILDDWQESHVRERRLVSVEEAAELVEEPILKELIRNLPAIISGSR